MKIKQGFPPNIEKIKKTFQLKGTEVFTYGDTVYLGKGGSLDFSLIAHEQTHLDQQAKIPAEEWWDKYLSDKNFRMSQELEAYRKQFKELKKGIKDRERLNQYLIFLAKSLSGPTYGNMCSVLEAMKMIKN